MRKIAIIISAIAITGGVSAQARFTDGGYLSRLGSFKTTDMAAFSQYNYTLGTARSSAMGGAFTSLGADLSSMSINPAGLGMYNGSEFSISPSVSISNTSNRRNSGIDNLDGSKSKFALGNLGLALNLYQGSGALTSFTLGFGYNRLADFNTSSEFGFLPDQHSYADVAALHLYGINSELLGSKDRPFDNPRFATEDWGAILGYQTSLIDPVDGSNMYTVGALTPNTTNSHYAKFDTKGYLGEYNISGGFNFSNIIYMGFSFGIQDIYYSTTARYEEAYQGSPQTPKYLDFMAYQQSLKMSGSGINFKFGITAQPAKGLKIGVAFHSPTYVNIQRDYQAGMYTQFYPASNHQSPDTGDRETPVLQFSPKYTTPPRLLTGISYTFGNIGIISADYERVWYNGMRLKTDDANTNDDFKSQIKNDFKGQNSFRLGVEVRATKQFSLRAGYQNTGSIINDNSSVFNAPVAYKQDGFSFGAGYKLGMFNIDLAYAMNSIKYTEYDLFYYKGLNNQDQNVIIESGGINQKINNHNITLSLGWRF